MRRSAVGVVLVFASLVACKGAGGSEDELGGESSGSSEGAGASTGASETAGEGGSSGSSSSSEAGSESSASDDAQDGEAPTDSEGEGPKFDTLMIGDGADVDLIDCSEVPPAPLTFQPMPGARGYHDVALDDEGKIIGSDGFALIKATYAGATSLFVPGLGTVQQMDWLDDGDLAIAVDATASILRIAPNGSSSTIAADVGAYGLVTGDDGMLYAANTTAVLRIDPDTGVKTTVVPNFGVSPRVLNFSPDNETLYIGTYLGNGSLYAVAWDAQSMQPTGMPYVFATGVGGGAYHDTMPIDACGNLYVADFTTQSMYRVTPEGETSVYINFNVAGYGYGHGAEFGNGKGGLREDALYIAQPYTGNSVTEVVIGVPSREYAWMTKP